MAKKDDGWRFDVLCRPSAAADPSNAYMKIRVGRLPHSWNGCPVLLRYVHTVAKRHLSNNLLPVYILDCGYGAQLWCVCN